MWKEFREFAFKGNVIDLAVAVIVGATFGKIVASLVSDVLMPPLGFLMGGVDFSNIFIPLSRTSYTTLADAKAAGVATINIGLFLNAVIDFLIVVFAVFLMVKQLRRFVRQPAPAPTTKECTFCATAIPLKATRCPNCTSQL